MAIVATAIPSLDIKYTLVDNSINASTSTEVASVGYTTLQFTNGTGTGNIDIGSVVTGSINSGEKIVFDFRLFPKNIFGSEFTLDFTSTTGTVPHPLISGQKGIKAILISNGWDGILNNGLNNLTGLVVSGSNSSYGYPPDSGFPQISIHATGLDGFSGLFGGGIQDGRITQGNSGYISLNPSGTWAYTDIIGKTPIYDNTALVYQHKLTLSAEYFIPMFASGGTGVGGGAIYYPLWNDYTSGSPFSGNVATVPYQIVVVGVTGGGE
jgi:hypothetical protein